MRRSGFVPRHFSGVVCRSARSVSSPAQAARCRASPDERARLAGAVGVSPRGGLVVARRQSLSWDVVRTAPNGHGGAANGPGRRPKRTASEGGAGRSRRGGAASRGEADRAGTEWEGLGGGTERSRRGGAASVRSGDGSNPRAVPRSRSSGRRETAWRELAPTLLGAGAVSGARLVHERRSCALLSRGPRLRGLQGRSLA